jgi:hypothetical protein
MGAIAHFMLEPPSLIPPLLETWGRRAAWALERIRRGNEREIRFCE